MTCIDATNRILLLTNENMQLNSFLWYLLKNQRVYCKTIIKPGDFDSLYKMRLIYSNKCTFKKKQ